MNWLRFLVKITIVCSSEWIQNEQQRKVIDSGIDDLNEILSGLTPEKGARLKDLRRKVKNRSAAQKSRKRRKRTTSDLILERDYWKNRRDVAQRQLAALQTLEREDVAQNAALQTLNVLKESWELARNIKE